MFKLTEFTFSTDAQAREYVYETYMRGAPDTEVDRVMGLYPDGEWRVPDIPHGSPLTWLRSSDPTQGSPFNTGEQNKLSPQFKRMAALIGDVVFIAPRRYFAQSRSHQQPVYVFSGYRLYLWPFGMRISSFEPASDRFKDLEHLGATHSSDLVDLFNGGVTTDYFIQFIAHMDPNGRSTSHRSILRWPKYSNELPAMMIFSRDDVPVSIGLDDYREEALNNWNKLVLGSGSGPLDR